MSEARPWGQRPPSPLLRPPPRRLTQRGRKPRHVRSRHLLLPSESSSLEEHLYHSHLYHSCICGTPLAKRFRVGLSRHSRILSTGRSILIQYPTETFRYPSTECLQTSASLTCRRSTIRLKESSSLCPPPVSPHHDQLDRLTEDTPVAYVLSSLATVYFRSKNANTTMADVPAEHQGRLTVDWSMKCQNTGSQLRKASVFSEFIVSIGQTHQF